MPLKIAFSRPENRVSTKTLLLKHYYRRQGTGFVRDGFGYAIHRRKQKRLRTTWIHFAPFVVVWLLSSAACLEVPKSSENAKGVVLCERTCFSCFCSTFYKRLPSKNPSKNLVFTENPYRRLLRTLLSSIYC